MIRQTVIVTALWLGALLPLQAQVFAFIQNTSGLNHGMPVTGYKYEVANRVFTALLKARGDYRLQTPTLVMNTRERYVAWMDPDNIQIGLEEKAYDVCVAFGKDSLIALAALLSHELTHYYEKHDWSRHFVRENEDLETAHELERLEEGLKQEAQADYLGGFLALSVGYHTYGIMPTLLKKVYQSYGLPDRLPGYPSLQDRLTMVEGAMNRLEELSVMYELGNTLTVMGNYEAAATYYRSILPSYQSREIYNNAGANTLLAALSYFGPTEMPYVLPIELDPETRMTGSKNVEAERLKKRKVLLDDAVKLFAQAVALDADYAPAYLNYACALALQKEYEDAAFWLKKGQKRSKQPKLSADLKVMEALLEAMQGNRDEGIAILEQAAAGSPLARTNLDVLLQKPVATALSTNAVKGLEQIEQYRLSDFLSNPTVDKQVAVSETVFCGIQKRTQSRILIHYADNGAAYAVAQETLPGYAGKTNRGIQLQSGEADVQTAYGVPDRVVGVPNGQILVYATARIYFRLDEAGKVTGWGVFLQNE